MCPTCGKRIRGFSEEKKKGDGSVAPSRYSESCNNCYRRSKKDRVKRDWASTKYFCIHCNVPIINRSFKKKNDGYALHYSGGSCRLCVVRLETGQPILKFVPDERTCTLCFRTLPNNLFHITNNSRIYKPISSRSPAKCRDCIEFFRKYKITYRDYVTLREQQDGKCYICLRPEEDFQRKLHVDHDHSCCPGKRSCGKCVRRLLCPNCNIGLGKIRDDLEIINSMIQYLEKGVDVMVDP